MSSPLAQLDLTENEERVYLSYLRTGEQTAATIARTLSMDKSSCYRAVESLCRRGLLISHPKQRGTTHSAVNPDVLHELLKEKQAELAQTKSSLDSFIRKLKTDVALRSTFIKVEKGLRAVQLSMERNLEDAHDKLIREKYRLDYPYFKDKNHIRFVTDFARRRISAGVSIRQIVAFAEQTVFSPIMHTDKKLLKEIRLMPPELSDNDALRVSGDTVTIISFDPSQDYIVITIHDAYVASMMKHLFDFIWTRSTKYL